MNWKKINDELNTWGIWGFVGIVCLVSLLIKFFKWAFLSDKYLADQMEG
ncbi:MAG: hypothetical protein SH818_05480 [Saprospiraceae bacterium]|nr:hypothetical protein [Saprospiraceae bacterium]